MTYLEAVNNILVRLREDQVTSVTQTDYSSLIGSFVNDSKRIVEDAFNWGALTSFIPINTVGGTSNYSVTGSGKRFRVVEILDTTNKYELKNVPLSFIKQQQYLATNTNSQPMYYAFNGVDSSGDTKVELYPTPNSIYTLVFHLIVPQATLTTGSTVISVPEEPIILGAYSMALVERGEDQGLTSSEVTTLYRIALADAIAIESGRQCENEVWSAT